MLLWVAILGAMLAIFGGSLLYISCRAARFPLVRRITGDRRGLGRLLCLGCLLALMGLLWALWNLMNAVVCLIHLVVFWMLCDLAVFVISKIRRRPVGGQWAGAAALVLCAAYLAAGWVADHRVWRQDYAFESPKLSRELTLALIADAHVGATFDGAGFEKHLSTVADLRPDALLVAGDFVDDDTSRADMLAACDALGRFQAPCGVYFVYGNHDKGYYAESSRGWTGAELRAALEQNGVRVLEDECVEVGDDLCIAGRKDRSEAQRGGGRLSAQALLDPVDHGRYIVLLDHQPHDYADEAAAGADLVLSGHTHGGQFIPIRHVGEWLGENALRYGHKRLLNTDFIVTSGISNWAFRFKTGCRSEYVLIRLLPQT